MRVWPVPSRWSTPREPRTACEQRPEHPTALSRNPSEPRTAIHPARTGRAPRRIELLAQPVIRMRPSFPAASFQGVGTPAADLGEPATPSRRGVVLGAGGLLAHLGRVRRRSGCDRLVLSALLGHRRLPVSCHDRRNSTRFRRSPLIVTVNDADEITVVQMKVPTGSFSETTLSTLCRSRLHSYRESASGAGTAFTPGTPDPGFPASRAGQLALGQSGRLDPPIPRGHATGVGRIGTTLVDATLVDAAHFRPPRGTHEDDRPTPTYSAACHRGDARINAGPRAPCDVPGSHARRIRPVQADPQRSTLLLWILNRIDRA